MGRRVQINLKRNAFNTFKALFEEKAASTTRITASRLCETLNPSGPSLHDDAGISFTQHDAPEKNSRSLRAVRPTPAFRYRPQLCFDAATGLRFLGLGYGGAEG